MNKVVFNKLSRRLIDVSEFVFVLMYNIFTRISDKNKSTYVHKFTTDVSQRTSCLDKHDRIIQQLLSRDMQ